MATRRFLHIATPREFEEVLRQVPDFSPRDYGTWRREQERDVAQWEASGQHQAVPVECVWSRYAAFLNERHLASNADAFRSYIDWEGR